MHGGLKSNPCPTVIQIKATVIYLACLQQLARYILSFSVLYDFSRTYSEKSLQKFRLIPSINDTNHINTHLAEFPSV